MLSSTYHKNIAIISEKINEADAIVVGGASGMSTAAGYNWYRNDENFRKHFGPFIKKYGIDNIFNGFYYHYPTKEERWAYIATLIKFVLDAPIGQPYLDLHEILQGKNYYILTTNQDIQFSKLFPEEKVSAIQGDWRYFQCIHRCHDHIYRCEEQVQQMYANIEDTKIPTELIPICPECGGDMEPWVRSFVFLEGTKYKNEHMKCRDFLLKNQSKKILFLELGVGQMTPMFIKEPFWNMTYAWPNAFYITINPEDAVLPLELKDKGLAVHEDIARVLRDVISQC